MNAQTKPGDLRATFAKFTSLGRPDVADHLTMAWADALAWLAQEPAEGFEGQMAHGGWSPVRYDPPKRAKEHAREVFALVLDHDKGGSWDKVRALWAASYGLIYTTKSHGAPGTTGDRLRVVLPLSRSVTVEEHGRLWAWASKRCAEAGCPADPQAKDASRFWYDASIPPGGWRAELLAGEVLDVEAVLAEVERPQLRVVERRESLTPDVRVTRATRYLERIPGAVSGQAGHTATFNAVAHVMIGFDLDPDTTLRLVTDHYNPRCTPPWSERELLHKIRSVSERCDRPRGYLLQAERKPVHTVQQAADRAPAVPDELTVEWRGELAQKKDGSVRRGPKSTTAFIRFHPDYRGRWSLNTMTEQVWFDGRPMPEEFIHELRTRIDQDLGYAPAREDVEGAIAVAARDRPFHPIQQYLRSIDWDGTPRLQAMARDYLHSEDPLHAELVRKWMISAVARALKPGAKVDTALMLVGAQGIRKSTFFRVLGGTWHADSPIDIANKDSFAQIHAAWIYEFSELENVVHGRAESRLKAWLTSTHDMYRAPYAKTVTQKARSCVICGTTNRRGFLTDDTGSRRFWIVPVKQEVPCDLLAELRDQLWAEAVCAYEAGETWWLDREIDQKREVASVEFTDEDPWRAPIADWISSPAIQRITITDLLTSTLKVDISRQTRADQMRVARVLHELGWERRRETTGERRWFYTRAEA